MHASPKILARVRRGAAAVALAAVSTAIAPSGCSLGNVAQDDCSDDAACVAAFGLGSTCDDGYCAAPAGCSVNADCRAAVGAPAVVCSEARCRAATLDPRCTVTEPEDLAADLASGAGPGDRLLIGALFEQDDGNQTARTGAVRLAVREMNAAGGVRGRSLGLVVCDPAGAEQDPTIVEQLVLHLGDELGAPVVIGPAATADAIVATNAVLASGVPVAILTPSATGVQLTGQPDRLDPADPLGLLWRTAPSDELQAAVLADVVAEALAGIAAPTVAVVVQDDAYGQSLERALRQALLDRLDGVTIEAETFDLVDLEDEAVAAAGRAAAAEPDAVVVLAGRADRALAVLRAAADEAALAPLPFFLSDGAKDASVLLASDDPAIEAILEGALGTAPANPTDGSFFDALENEFGVEASQFGFVAHAYDAAYVAALGLARAARPGAILDGRAVVDGFARLAEGDEVVLGPSAFSSGVAALQEEDGSIDVVGESGPLDFDAETGEAPGPIEVWRVADGGFERVGEPVTP